MRRYVVAPESLSLYTKNQHNGESLTDQYLDPHAITRQLPVMTNVYCRVNYTTVRMS